MNIIISNSAHEPIYEQIAVQIKDSIINSELKEGELLPSIRALARALAKDLKVSVITTKRAYDELEKDGFITTVPGKGCYVAPQNTELLRESRLKIIEDNLQKAVDAAKSIEIGLDDLKYMIEILYKEV